jgi:hypothetical protein
MPVGAEENHTQRKTSVLIKKQAPPKYESMELPLFG